MLLGETMVNPMSLLVISLELPSYISDFAPEPVANCSHRYSECLGDSLPVVARRPENQHRAVSFTEFSDDVLQIQSRVYLTPPIMVYCTTRQLNGPTCEFEATRFAGESSKRAREGQQEQSIFPRRPGGADPVEIARNPRNAVFHHIGGLFRIGY